MLHWPDSMFSYLVDDKILFSQDGFGMHLASSERFADQIEDSILEYEAAKYFANILTLYSGNVVKLLEKVAESGLEFDMIAPDHGPIWRETPERIVEMYARRREFVHPDPLEFLYDYADQRDREVAGLVASCLAYLANHSSEQPISTGVVAKSLKASEAHLSKVFQRLARMGLVRSVRGPKGGFSLAEDPESVTLLEIYQAIDGGLGRGECLMRATVCDRETCIFGHLLDDVYQQVEQHFSGTTLADLIED